MTTAAEGRSATEPARVTRALPVWCLAVVVAVLAALAVVLHQHNGQTPLTSWCYGSVALAVTMLAPAALIAARRPDNPIGWLLCAACLCEALCSFGREYLIYGLLGGTAPGWLWLGWFSDSCYLVAIACLPTMLMLFPDGRPATPALRKLVALPAAGLVIGWFGYAFTPDVTRIGAHRLANPAGELLPALLTVVAARVGQLLMLLALLAAVVVLFARLRRAEGVLRQQLKWVAWAGSIEAIEVITEFIPGNGAAVYISTATDALLVGALAIAILRHQLLDIDLVINRTLVFAVLSTLVVGVYLLVVLGLGAAVGERPAIGPGLVATAVVAAGFAPARAMLQRGVDRLLYGERRNPYQVMIRLGQQLERPSRSDELSAVVETVTDALKLPYAAIADASGIMLAGSDPDARAPASLVAQPLHHQGECIGRLLVAPRAGAPGLTRHDRRLLADLARPVSAAVHAVQLSAALQTSRQRLVTAKEAERQRLRRDLHDGLGPKLAALGLKVDAAYSLADTSPQRSRDLLSSVKSDIRETIDDIRRLVYALRPPALDELGLIGALRECAERFDTTATLEISVIAPEALTALPAAVEVAVYSIVNEALTNVVRHSAARRCEVRIDQRNGIRVLVRDDGTGLPPGWRAGVGTASMSERAAELGGTLTVGNRTDGQGSEVVAWIPT